MNQADRQTDSIPTNALFCQISSKRITSLDRKIETHTHFKNKHLQIWKEICIFAITNQTRKKISEYSITLQKQIGLWNQPFMQSLPQPLYCCSFLSLLLMSRRRPLMRSLSLDSAANHVYSSDRVAFASRSSNDWTVFTWDKSPWISRPRRAFRPTTSST